MLRLLTNSIPMLRALRCIRPSQRIEVRCLRRTAELSTEMRGVSARGDNAMRNARQRMPEIIDTIERDGEHFGIVAVVLDGHAQAFEFGIDPEAHRQHAPCSSSSHSSADCEFAGGDTWT